MDGKRASAKNSGIDLLRILRNRDASLEERAQALDEREDEYHIAFNENV